MKCFCRQYKPRSKIEKQFMCQDMNCLLMSLSLIRLRILIGTAFFAELNLMKNCLLRRWLAKLSAGLNHIGKLPRKDQSKETFAFCSKSRNTMRYFARKKPVIRHLGRIMHIIDEKYAEKHNLALKLNFYL